jgi:hypothetical protein
LSTKYDPGTNNITFRTSKPIRVFNQTLPLNERRENNVTTNTKEQNKVELIIGISPENQFEKNNNSKLVFW